MLQTIKRQDAISQYPALPVFAFDVEESPYPRDAFYFDVVCMSSSRRWFAKHLAQSLIAFLTELKITELIFLGSNNRAWLSQQNKYPTVERAMAYLLHAGIGKRFNGAIKVPVSDWPEFLPHFYWLVRGNASLPWFHFTDPDQRIVVKICQYGGVHFYAFDKKVANKCKTVLFSCGFRQIDSNKC